MNESERLLSNLRSVAQTMEPIKVPETTMEDMWDSLGDTRREVKRLKIATLRKQHAAEMKFASHT